VELGDHPHRERPPAPRPLRERLEEARRLLGLEEVWDRSVESLSGGEAQRVVLARALVQDTPVLLLDEPAAALDLHRQVELHRVLMGLASRGRAVLLATHDVNLPRLCGCDLYLLDRGGSLRRLPEAEAEQRGLLEEVYKTSLAPCRLDGVTCWFPPAARREESTQRG
jgi:iron complex transport system ATP-binding protein